MQLDLTILTKTKETIRYYESFGYGGKTLSIHVSNVLMQFITLQETAELPSANGR
jgi:hypothetical protein